MTNSASTVTSSRSKSQRVVASLLLWLCCYPVCVLLAFGGISVAVYIVIMLGLSGINPPVWSKFGGAIVLAAASMFVGGWAAAWLASRTHIVTDRWWAAPILAFAVWAVVATQIGIVADIGKAWFGSYLRFVGAAAVLSLLLLAGEYAFLRRHTAR